MYDIICEMIGCGAKTSCGENVRISVSDHFRHVAMRAPVNNGARLSQRTTCWVHGIDFNLGPNIASDNTNLIEISCYGLITYCPPASKMCSERVIELLSNGGNYNPEL